MRKITLLAAAFAFATAAHAQGTFPLNNIPIGKGPGKTGWTAVAPVDGQCFTSVAGVPTFAACSSLLSSGSLTKVDDTNVTLTLGGTPVNALFNSVSLTLGWTGTLSPARGGTGIGALGTGVATWLGTPSSANLRAALTDESGTGAALFQSGDLGTPTAGVITNLTGTCGTCVSNNFSAGNASNLSSGTLPAARTNGHMNGEPTNGNAAAGEVGEYIESVIPTGSAVALTSGVAANVTSIPLTAGDWDLSGAIVFNSAATTSFTNIASSGSTTSATFQSVAGRFAQAQFAAVTPNTIPITSSFGPHRFSLSGSQTVFLVAFSTFTVSTASAWGTIRARRAR